MVKSRKLIKQRIDGSCKKTVKVPIEGEDLRTEVERRKFSYTLYIPERRSGKDRRRDGQPWKDWL